MLQEVRQCVGCGAALQTTQTGAPGFVPASALAAEEPICRRCFRIRHYGEFSRVAVSQEQYAEEVARIIDKPGLVLYVLDVFDLSGSLVHNLARYIVGSQVIVVVNKTDVLPPEVNPESLEEWVLQMVQLTGIDPISVLFASAEKNRGFEELLDCIRAEGAQTVYAVGMANVGKSTLLNRLMAHLGQHTTTFTASRMPGTTLGAVGLDVQLDSRQRTRIVDTPGLIHGNRITDQLCADCLKLAVPSDTLHPRVFQLDSMQTLWLGGFARIDFEHGPHQPIVCYVSNRLVVHRTKTERADAIYHERHDEVLQAPCSECRTKLGDFLRYPVVGGRFQRDTQSQNALRVHHHGSDIVLAGLGWITLQGDDFRGQVYVPRGIDVSVRPKLVGGLTTVGRGRGGAR